MKKNIVLAVCWLLAMAACATAPYSGRKQLMLVSGDQMNAMGTQAFQQMLAQTPPSKDPEFTNHIQCVTDPIIKTVGQNHKDAPKQWNLAVIRDPTPNAFALPGGNIGVNVGILSVAKNDAQLATVLSHELGHVLAHHSAERVSQDVVAQSGLGVVQAFLGGSLSPQNQQLVMGALGLGAQYGVLMPFSRGQETEADVIGVHLMSQAGFDPRQSVELWKNMMSASKGGEPPQFLSTHPSSENRIKRLEEEIPKVMADYERSGGNARQPASSSVHACQRPSDAAIQKTISEAPQRQPQQ